MRVHPINHKVSPHRGVGYAVRVNTPVHSAAAGTVMRSGWQDPKNKKVGFGLRVTINHGRGKSHHSRLESN